MTVPSATATTITDAIRSTVLRRPLDESRARAVASAIMDGGATPSQIAALLVALRMKGETVEEITGFVRAMRDRAEPVPVDGEDLIDTCGTGGDGKGTFNVSTVVAFVAAGAGCRVAKHGNRSVSSRCGSSEVLERLGVEPVVEPRHAARCLEEAGVCFLFAPRYHRATHHAVVPRRETGIRSIFNIVGPLTNPAGARRQLVGVFASELTEPLAHVLGRLGSTHCLVVHGEEGLDEISLAGPTRVSELRDGAVRTFRLLPRDLGFRSTPLGAIRGGDSETNARIADDVLRGAAGAAREIVLLNAGAAIYVAGRAASIADGVGLARESIDTGRALRCLDTLRRLAGDGHA